MNIIAWIVLGLVAGAIAKAIYPGNQGGGILATMLLGIVGAFLGGTVYNLIVNGSIQLAGVAFSFGGFIVAILGAMLAIWIWGLVAHRA